MPQLIIHNLVILTLPILVLNWPGRWLASPSPYKGVSMSVTPLRLIYSYTLIDSSLITLCVPPDRLLATTGHISGLAAI